MPNDSQTPNSVEGRVVIVTGAARGLGRDYARMFARDGAKVALADVASDAVTAAAKELASEVSGCEVLAVTVDVTDADSIAAMVAAVVEKWGTVDVLINNAGIWGDLEPAPLSATKPSYFDLVLSVNLRGPLLCTQAVLEPITQAMPGLLAWLAGTSMSAYDKSFMHAYVANWAALAGKPAQAREHLAQALAAPSSDYRAGFYGLLSAAERQLGNAEAAWLLIQPYVGSGQVLGITGGELRAFKPFYDKVYGGSKSYRAYVAKLGAAASKIPPK